MDSEASFLWHGPVWFAGRPFPGTGPKIPGLTGDVDLVETARVGHALDAELPAAIVIDLASISESGLEADFWDILQAGVARLETDVPIIFLAQPGETIPEGVRPDVIVDKRIPDLSLFNLVCDTQRALMRSEEARIRRKTFGRVPGYGSAAHHQGTSGLLVIGMGGRFLDLQRAQDRKVTLVGAFDQNMGELFLSQRGFDAVILDSTLDASLENLRQIRMDARYASMPVLVIADNTVDIPTYFEAGASDVLMLPMETPELKFRLATAIRTGKRRRLADKTLAESHKWLTQQLARGGVTQDHYSRYLEMAENALGRRGLAVWEMRLLPENFETPAMATMLATDLYGTVLSIADATSREEDLVCFVHDVGPIAVLKSERGKQRLQARINAILGHTRL
ncbi:hypothetical protein [Roseibium sp.]|uniref:hypothetical protein n=1 Tax=Roseibium sp. TaxID=1936156 RepID=UPI003A969022